MIDLHESGCVLAAHGRDAGGRERGDQAASTLHEPDLVISVRSRARMSLRVSQPLRSTSSHALFRFYSFIGSMFGPILGSMLAS